MSIVPTRRRRAVGLTAAALAAALTLSACQSTADDTGAEGEVTGGTLTIYTTAQDVNFDPAKSQNLAITTLGLTARRLTTWEVTPGQETTVVPDLATDTGTPSDDGRTWTFTLKEGLELADGTPITSETIKHGLERSFAPELTGGLTYHKTLLEGGDQYAGPFTGEHLDSIETPDDRTIVFHLNRPYGDFPWVASTPAFAPVPLEEGAPEAYAKEAVSSGPYSIAEYRAGNEVRLERNDKWDRDSDPVRAAGPDEIVFALAQDASVVAQSLIADRGDTKDSFLASFVPAAQLAQAQADPNAAARLVTSGPGALEYLALNNDSAALKDERVRQAIQYAVDKEAYRTSKGGEITGEFATTLITPGIAGREEFSLYGDAPGGDVEKAKALLAEAGAEGISLRLVVEESDVRQAEAIQQGLGRVGVSVAIQPLDTSAYTAEVTNGDGSGYDLTLSSWQPDIPSPNANIAPLFDSSQIGNGNYNISRYRNADVDAAILEASSTIDPDEAAAKWAEIDRSILADAPVVPLIYSRNSFLHGSGVSTFEIGEFPAYPNYLTVTLGQ